MLNSKVAYPGHSACNGVPDKRLMNPSEQRNILQSINKY
jgi:hypothetical protein